MVPTGSPLEGPRRHEGALGLQVVAKGSTLTSGTSYFNKLTVYLSKWGVPLRQVDCQLVEVKHLTLRSWTFAEEAGSGALRNFTKLEVANFTKFKFAIAELDEVTCESWM